MSFLKPYEGIGINNDNIFKEWCISVPNEPRVFTVSERVDQIVNAMKLRMPEVPLDGLVPMLGRELLTPKLQEDPGVPG